MSSRVDAAAATVAAGESVGDLEDLVEPGDPEEPLEGGVGPTHDELAIAEVLLRAVDIDPEEFTGFAFGLGLDRLCALMYELDDIRLLYENDVRFLEQFRLP